MKSLTCMLALAVALGYLSTSEGKAVQTLPVLWYPPQRPQPQPIVIATPPPPPPIVPTCRVKGSFQIEDKCILVEQSKLRWFEAQRYCRQLGYKLAEITSGSYYFNLIGALRQRGLGYESYWLGAARSGTTRRFSWITSYTPIHPTFWAVTFVEGKGLKEPRDDYYRNCGLLDVTRSHFINTEKCTATHGFICEGGVSQAPITNRYTYFSDAEDDEEDSISAYLECEEGWTLWADGGRCYRIIEDSLSFSYASSACEYQNATLVTITSEEENVIIAGISQNVTSSLWIGLRKVPYGAFEWVTDEELDYENWAEGEPSLPTYESDVCADIAPEDGSWSDDLCATPKGSICEMAAAEKPYYYYYGDDEKKK